MNTKYRPIGDKVLVIDENNKERITTNYTNNEEILSEENLVEALEYKINILKKEIEICKSKIVNRNIVKEMIDVTILLSVLLSGIYFAVSSLSLPILTNLCSWAILIIPIIDGNLFYEMYRNKKCTKIIHDDKIMLENLEEALSYEKEVLNTVKNERQTQNSFSKHFTKVDDTIEQIAYDNYLTNAENDVYSINKERVRTRVKRNI